MLITGSRSWPDSAFVRAKLDDVLTTCRELNDRLTIVHGGCPSGPDAHAHAWTAWHHTRDALVTAPEVHLAPWTAPCRPDCWPNHRRQDREGRGWSTCPTAGFHRNSMMVALGADLCLAFINDRSAGASHCADAAQKAGIETLRFRMSSSGQLELPLA